MKKVDIHKIRKQMANFVKNSVTPFPVEPVFNVALEESCSNEEVRDALLDLRADKQLWEDACTFFKTWLGMSLVSLCICLQYEKESA